MLERDAKKWAPVFRIKSRENKDSRVLCDSFLSHNTLVGWQTLLADLSLILFMVTAAAMAASSGAASSRRPEPADSRSKPASDPPKEPALGEPLALWRGGGSQTLRHWLAGQQPDARQQLTITAYYHQGAAAQALASAQALVREAGPMGREARVIVTPAADVHDDETLVSLAYDQAPGMAEPGLARGLLVPSGHPSVRNPP